jgi:hypothetical protein
MRLQTEGNNVHTSKSEVKGKNGRQERKKMKCGKDIEECE